MTRNDKVLYIAPYFINEFFYFLKSLDYYSKIEYLFTLALYSTKKIRRSIKRTSSYTHTYFSFLLIASTKAYSRIVAFSLLAFLIHLNSPEPLLFL